MPPTCHIFMLIFLLNRFKTSVFHKKGQRPFKNADLKINKMLNLVSEPPPKNFRCPYFREEGGGPA